MGKIYTDGNNIIVDARKESINNMNGE